MKTIAILALSTAFASVAFGQTLSTSDFDGYSIGNLATQGSPAWTDDSAAFAYKISAENPLSGANSVRTDTSAFNATYYAWQDLSSISTLPANTLIVASVDAYVSSNAFDPASFAGLDAYQANPFDRMGGLTFRPTSGSTVGGVYALNVFGFVDSGLPAPSADSWHNLTLILNKTTGQFVARFDGQSLFGGAPIAMNSWVIGSSRFTDADLRTAPIGNNVIFYDNYKVEAIAPGRVNGNVELTDGCPPAGEAVTIEFRNGVNVVDTQSTTLDASGNFTVTTTARGNLVVAAKASHWLSRAINNVSVTDYGVWNVNFTGLVNGDMNNDNSIDIADYAILSAAYNSAPGDLNWNPDADINCDEAVDIADYAILSANYNQVGE